MVQLVFMKLGNQLEKRMVDYMKIHEIKLTDFLESKNQQLMISCIYSIKNLQSGKRYIGSCKSLHRRIRLHIRSLRHNNHHSLVLQRAFDKYQIENFCVEVLEKVDNCENLISREQYYLDFYNPDYNIAKVAGSSLGIKRSEETKEKVRKAILGVKHPQWRKELKSRVQLGRTHKKFSEEGRQNCSKAQKRLFEQGFNAVRGRKASEKHFRPVIQYTRDGQFIKKWECAIKIKEELNLSTSNNILSCCKGKGDFAYGYRWQFAQ